MIDPELQNIADEITNETRIGANTAQKIGALFSSLIEKILPVDDISQQPGTSTTKVMSQAAIRAFVYAIRDAILKGSGFNLDSIQFNPATETLLTNIGQLRWNAAQQTLEFKCNSDVVLSIGQENYLRGKNAETTQIVNGTVVYVSGGLGANALIKRASNNNTTGERVIGVATQNIAANNIGFVTTNGIVNEINTSAFAEGDVLWLGVDGALTNVKPGTDVNQICIGVVLRSHATQGSLLVSVKDDWRDQVAQLRSDLSQELTELARKVIDVPMNINGYINADGKFTSNASWRCTDYFVVREGDEIEVFNRINDNTPIVYCYDGNKELLSNSPTAVSGNVWAKRIATIPEGTVYARVHTAHSSTDNYYTKVNSANVQTSSTELFEKIVGVKDEVYGKTALVINPIIGGDWSKYTKELARASNIMWANYQSEKVNVSGVIMPAYLFPASPLSYEIKVYLGDIKNMSSMVLLKHLKNPKDVNYIYFDTPVEVGGDKQIFVTGGGVKYYNDAATGAKIYFYDGTSLTERDNSTVCMAYSLIFAESISERFDRLEKQKGSAEDYVVTPTSIIKGFWYRDELKKGGNYDFYRTHQDAIPFEDMTLVANVPVGYTPKFGFSLFNSSMQPLGNYPQNADLTNGKVGYRVRMATKFPAYSTAKFCRVNFWVEQNGAAVNAPEGCSFSVISGKYKQEIKVAKDGSGDYLTINDAVNNAFDNPNKPVTIKIGVGVYDEIVYVMNDRFLSFVGEDKTMTVIESHTGKYEDAPITIDGDFSIENLTLRMLDDRTPSDWTPGTSAPNLCGYALHVDHGNGDFPPLNGEYKLGRVSNCILYSVSNAALGCGVHANNKVVFENCDFVRETTKQSYKNVCGTTGAFLIHDSNDSISGKQMVEMINCRCYSNIFPSAKFEYNHSADQTLVSMVAVGNSFYESQNDSNSVAYTKGNSKLLGISNGNNNDYLNA